MKVQILAIENPEPMVLFFAEGRLHDYCTRDRYLRTGRAAQWLHFSQRCPKYHRLGFDDGLMIGTHGDYGDGRLTLSGHSIWRLIFASATQRADLDSSSETVGRFFAGDDRKRVEHWVDEVFPRLMWPDRYPPADAVAQRIVDGELSLRSSVWAEIRQVATLSQAVS